MKCNFDNTDRTCPTCGYKAKRLPTYRECRQIERPEWQPIMVGDLVEKALTAIGITQERAEKLTRTAGKPGGCGCGSRKTWLNEKGVAVQKAIREMAKKVYGVG